MEKILIVIQGGIVQNILTTNSKVEVCVIDYDQADLEYAVCVRETSKFNGNWADTIEGKDLSNDEKVVKVWLTSLDGEFPMKEPKHAREIVRYFEVYKKYLTDNNLDDDSKSISVEDLVDFVDNQIDPEDKEEYYQQTSL